MNNTYQILLNWDKGQPFAERMAGKILGIENYSELDPQCPTGGPDGTKDILCNKDNRKYVVGCYFPNGQRSLKEIEEKISNDYQGVEKHNADGFIFITNQKITPGERLKFAQDFVGSEIYHLERIVGVLDSPKGYGVRLEYLGVELTKAEQISFLESYLDLKSHFEEIKSSLEYLKKVTNGVALDLKGRDVFDFRKGLSVLPVAGINFSSRISVEDLFSIHLACLYEERHVNLNAGKGFRKSQVWIGRPGCSANDADFVPCAPEDVPVQINELLEWWRTEYQNIVYGDEMYKATSIARFHERFLSIHPFFDGNGRVARVIATQQFRELLGKNILFEELENRSDYYLALKKANSDEHKALVGILLSLAR